MNSSPLHRREENSQDESSDDLGDSHNGDDHNDHSLEDVKNQLIDILESVEFKSWGNTAGCEVSTALGRLNCEQWQQHVNGLLLLREGTSIKKSQHMKSFKCLQAISPMKVLMKAELRRRGYVGGLKTVTGEFVFQKLLGPEWKPLERDHTILPSYTESSVLSTVQWSTEADDGRLVNTIFLTIALKNSICARVEDRSSADRMSRNEWRKTRYWARIARVFCERDGAEDVVDDEYKINWKEKAATALVEPEEFDTPESDRQITSFAWSGYGANLDNVTVGQNSVNDGGNLQCCHSL